MTLQIHEGQRLRKWIEKSNIPVIDIVQGVGLKSYSHLYYYYPQERIRKTMLEKICKALGITLDEFYHGELIKGIIDEENAISFHQGINLRSTLKSIPLTVTAFAGKMGISKKTVYEYFKESKLDDDFLQRSAKILKVQPARLKGNDVHEYTASDVYYLLKKVNEKVDKLIHALSAKAS
jgi:transcriptional regulator with XRE-family HTH domain